MQKYALIIFILCLPIFAVIGHDGYMTYKDQNFNKPMMFSNVGYLWTHYEADSFNTAKKETPPDQWSKFVVPVLEERSVEVAAVPLAIGVIFIALIELLRHTIFRGMRRKKKKTSFGFEGLREDDKI